MDQKLYETAIGDGLTAMEIADIGRRENERLIELSNQRMQEAEAEARSYESKANYEVRRAENLKNKLIALCVALAIVAIAAFLTAVVIYTRSDSQTYTGYNLVQTCEKGKPCPSPFQTGGTP